MIGQSKHGHAVHLRLAGDDHAAAISHFPTRAIASSVPSTFPRRPDGNALSVDIPLFYIVRNRNGFWLARDAAARDGGMFLFKRSALRFAAQASAPSGCATMVLAGPLELDVPNRGNLVVARLDAAVSALARRMPAVFDFARMAVAEWRRLGAQISRALASERRHRRAIERELFHDQYTLSSKNDDDLPIAS